MPRYPSPLTFNDMYFFQSPLVSVELCDSITHKREHIATIPIYLIARHAPKWFPIITPNICLGTLTLTLLVPTLSHASDIEVPALTLLFTSWLTHMPFPTQPMSSIAEIALAYRALQLAQHLDADNLWCEILQRLHTEPVNEVDVQTLWWVFQHTGEFFKVIDALLFNIVRFGVLDTQPSGGLILHFIETELLQLHERAQERVLQMYVKRMQAFARASLMQRVCKAWNSVFGARERRVPLL